MRFLALIVALSLPALGNMPPEKQPEAAAPMHPQGIEKVPTGVIEGGWAYVYAAYGAGLLGLLAYAASLFLRRSTQLPPPGAP